MLAQQSLPQNKGVLRANRDDQGKAGGEACRRGRQDQAGVGRSRFATPLAISALVGGVTRPAEMEWVS